MSAENENEAQALNELMARLDPDSRTFAAEALLGGDAEEFANSDLGKYMIGCAQQDLDLAHIKLARTMPFRWRAIAKLQNDIRCAEQFLTYIRDLVIRGRAAEMALQEREE
jgi:hypothetical protein